MTCHVHWCGGEVRIAPVLEMLASIFQRLACSVLYSVMAVLQINADAAAASPWSEYFRRRRIWRAQRSWFSGCVMDQRTKIFFFFLPTSN